MKNLLLVFLFVFSGSVVASGSSGQQKIASIKLEPGSGIFVYPKENFLNPDNCGNSSAALIKQSDAERDAKLSLVLAAYMGGKTVQSWFVGCESTPWGYTVPIMYNTTILD